MGRVECRAYSAEWLGPILQPGPWICQLLSVLIVVGRKDGLGPCCPLKPTEGLNGAPNPSSSFPLHRVLDK